MGNEREAAFVQFRTDGVHCSRVLRGKQKCSSHRGGKRLQGVREAPLHAAIGKDVEFVRRNEGERMTSADAIIDGLIWEMKAPTADNLKAIERNLKRGRWQSENIIFDCRRMKKVPDAAIEREVRKQAFAIPRIKRLRYVNKHGQVVDIKG